MLPQVRHDGPVRLGDATWNEVQTLLDDPVAEDGTRSPVVLIAVGSTEQHGPHLPMSTDTLIAEEVVARAIHLTDGLMIGPTIAISASGEHAGFPGTLSIGTSVMHDVILELGRSADWAAGVVFVNGHGGNSSAVNGAVTTLRQEGRHVLSWWPKWPQRADGGAKDLHAGRIETSLMLAIDPGLVRLELAAPGVDADLDELRRVGVRPVSPSGVLGDPTGASGGEGDQFITTFVSHLVHAIEAWRPIDPTPIG
jgi:mycofactocin system creatininase family protein